MENLPLSAKDQQRRRERRLPIWLCALLSQLLGGFAGFAAYLSMIDDGTPGLDIIDAGLISGVAAALVGRMIFRMPSWWLPINCVFLPGAWVVHNGQFPAWVFAALFLATLLIFWNVIRDRVPLYLSNETTSTAVATFLEELKPEALEPATKPASGMHQPVGRLCDLGSGTGGFAARLASACPRWQVVGYESAPVLWLASILRASFGPRRLLTFQRRNFWSLDFETFDVIYVFLSPEPMTALFDKAKAEMKPGSVLISNSFEVPGETPDEVRVLDDRRETRLLIWRF